MSPIITKTKLNPAESYQDIFCGKQDNETLLMDELYTIPLKSSATCIFSKAGRMTRKKY